SRLPAWTATRVASEHSVLVCRLFGNVRNHVPMLYHFPVVDSEDIHDGSAGGAVTARGVDMQDDQVAFGDHLFDVAVLARKAGLEKVDERFQSLRSIVSRRVVLLVLA